MSKEYYQMGWTLDDTYNEDYFCSRDNQRYFIKKNTTPMIATLSAEGIVPRLRWTKRISNGDVLIAQDFENGRTLNTEDMRDKRIPEILKKENYSRGVVIRQEEEGVAVDVYIIVGYGTKISAICRNVQEQVKYNLETMLGFSANTVNVYVQGVKIIEA